MSPRMLFIQRRLCSSSPTRSWHDPHAALNSPIYPVFCCACTIRQCSISIPCLPLSPHRYELAFSLVAPSIGVAIS
ncbi:hypothetical protein Cob_v004911 [Colletotrichum orbiculare MAFF 240422]|uniref:Uncharacterized protein n=1 Tax=Colletotrichum orbiculare (strain 104-T / ATCC 96160 / CBS 514.97 / LARS 414 / MAFF 240422) TaxID=1213857 RepID=A0A484FW80_COLOR|nr:hypothetical protein Cob_v004911 [Colletotrichum orbiculare MAFF 240422]